MAKFRKKPVEIESMQFDGTNARAVMDWAHAGLSPVANSIVIHDINNNHLMIRTLEGTMTAFIGDWIIKGVKGEFYPCKPDIFAQTYTAEPVPPLPAPASETEQTFTRAEIDRIVAEVIDTDEMQMRFHAASDVRAAFKLKQPSPTAAASAGVREQLIERLKRDAPRDSERIYSEVLTDDVHQVIDLLATPPPAHQPDEQLVECESIRDSYQAAFSRIGLALVEAGFEDDRTEDAVYSALKELARLRATPPPADGLRAWAWIESAPKDGTDVLLRVPPVNGQHDGFVVVGNWSGEWRDNWGGRRLDLANAPTHWLSLDLALAALSPSKEEK